jgi:hypothetical protein
MLPEDAPKEWTEMITGSDVTGNKSILVGEAFEHFPGALLISKTDSQVQQKAPLSGRKVK